MIQIAHIIHPAIVPPPSDLVAAQPITFETMSIARTFTKGSAQISLYAIQYQDDDRIRLPRCFTRVTDLRRSVADIKTFKERRKLALIKDILDPLYAVAAHADYFIYTNVDIALQPYFYRFVAQIIRQGYDAFVINRRTISEKFSSIDQIPIMYAEVGESHKGYDCFVFRREFYPKFKLGNICIGTAWIGRALLANMVAFSTKFKEFKNEHLTFHIGNSQAWRQDDYQDYFRENHEEFLRIFRQLEAARGGFSPLWRSYLLDTGSRRQFPDFK